MSILNYKRIREKWGMNFFVLGGIHDVIKKFKSDSIEMRIWESLLFNFSMNCRFDNKYELMRGVPIDLYEKELYYRCMKLMSTINFSEDTNFKIFLKGTTIYVELM